METEMLFQNSFFDTTDHAGQINHRYSTRHVLASRAYAEKRQHIVHAERQNPFAGRLSIEAILGRFRIAL